MILLDDENNLIHMCAILEFVIGTCFFDSHKIGFFLSPYPPVIKSGIIILF